MIFTFDNKGMGISRTNLISCELLELVTLTWIFRRLMEKISIALRGKEKKAFQNQIKRIKYDSYSPLYQL